MDGVYGDLENYNDVNAFEELIGENSDLKTKLDDYEVKYAILQEEFDKLAANYKKLEMNYSSLLKTARAEVARKTQIITTFNSEKDMMILSAIQNSAKSIHSIRNVRDKSSSHKSRRDEMDPRLVKKEKPEIKRYELGLGRDHWERIQEKRLPSTDTVSSGNMEDTNALENKLRKLASYDIDDSKENIAKSKRALSLKHRRKSMPVVSKLCAKFSSDEGDDNCLAEDHNRERPPREDKSSKSFDRHKLSHKISETSGIDEKYSSYHESSRETYYKGKSQKYSDKYRSLRDKFDSRNRRHYSPERRRRGAREFPAETYQRSEFPRHRVLESPPVEKYDPQQRFREHGSIIERDYTQPETNVHPQLKLGKHKLTSDYDEPSNKKARTNSSTRPSQENTGRPKEKVSFEEKLALGFGSHLNNTSCQSPDYLHSDVDSTQPKEIMSTAVTKLEDPRLQSKRYVKKKYGDMIVFSSVSGREKDLKLIDTSTWDIKRIEVPEALKNPPDYRGKNTQDLYNFDNPMLSEESGEIHSESNDMNMTDYVNESFFQDYENERINQENVKVNRYVLEEPKQVSAYAIGQRDNYIPKEAERRLPPVRYKLIKPVQAESESTNPLGLLLEQMKDKCGVSTSKAHDTKLDVDQTFGKSPLKNSAKDNMVETQPREQIREGRKITAREIVAQDLELSDETYDNLVVKKYNNKEKIYIPEAANHENIRENEIPKQKKSRKSKTEEEKQTEIPQLPKDAVTHSTSVTDSKSNTKTKNKPKSISPKISTDEEVETSKETTSAKPKVEKIQKEVSDNPLEKARNKTSDQQEIKKVQKKSKTKTEAENARIKISDQPEAENVTKKTIDKAQIQIEKDDKINGPLEVKMVAKKASDEQEPARIQRKTSEKPELGKGPKSISVVPEVEKDPKSISVEPEVEKDSLKTSEALEVKEIQKRTSNKSKVEKVRKRTSYEPEVQKVQKKTSKPELQDVQKKTSNKPELEKNPKPNDGDKSEKKTKKSKDTKANDKKAKFSELFGDSCSLITPEELGLHIAPTVSAKIYVPIFEDAQDSVDVSEKMLKETKPAPATISNLEPDQCELNKRKLEPDIPAVSSTELTGKADNLMVSIPIKITPHMDISKLITKEPVSTVIISTGVQPGIDSNGSIKLSSEKPQQLNIPEGPVALATSTPFKRLLEAEVENCNSSEKGSKKDDTTSSVNHSYDSNADPQNEDVPDVRIFIRRRRKVKKSM